MAGGGGGSQLPKARWGDCGVPIGGKGWGLGVYPMLAREEGSVGTQC